MRFFAFLIALTLTSDANASNLNSSSVMQQDGITRYETPAIVLGDVPLMDGLHTYYDSALIKIFPQAQEDLTSVTAVGIVDVDDVYSFYQTEMPKLGWTSLGARDFLKDDTVLHINAQATGKTSVITFTKSAIQR